VLPPGGLLLLLHRLLLLILLSTSPFSFCREVLLFFQLLHLLFFLLLILPLLHLLPALPLLHLQCGQPSFSYTESCPACRRLAGRQCGECGYRGHRDRDCPDLWRRLQGTGGLKALGH
jgi:hypothetical protein